MTRPRTLEFWSVVAIGNAMGLCWWGEIGPWAAVLVWAYLTVLVWLWFKTGGGKRRAP